MVENGECESEILSDNIEVLLIHVEIDKLLQPIERKGDI